MPLDALILDVDGTLVDTNSLHVRAWKAVFERHGFRVADDRIFEEVGKGGDQLVPSILGREINRRQGEELAAGEPVEFAKMARAEGIRVFPRVVQLLQALRQRGLKLVLATSSTQKQLQVIEQSAGLDLSGLVDLVLTADDADRSKPAPDLLQSALQKLSMTPAQCAMLGDTPWDVESARRAGLVCIGVLCGGNSRRRLRDAGARAIYNDPADLLDHLDPALAAVSPLRLRLTWEAMRDLMGQALQMAQAGVEHGEVPIGAVVADADGRIIGRGHNRLNATQNKTAHAEMVAFADSAGKVPVEVKNLILISTLEPCVMCTAASMEAAVDTILYGLPAPPDSGTARVSPPISPESQMPRIIGQILAEQSRSLLEQWLQSHGGTQQAAYVRQLLSSVGANVS